MGLMAMMRRRMGRWWQKKFGKPKTQEARDDSRRDLGHVHQHLVKQAGKPGLLARIFRRGRSKRYNHLLNHLNTYKEHEHHSPEKLQTVLDHIDEWRGREEGSAKRYASVDRARAHVSTLRDIAKSNRGQRNWKKARRTRFDVREPLERQHELRHMRLRRGVAAAHEVNSRGAWTSTEGLGKDDQDRQAMMSHPIVSGVTDVASRQKTMLDGAKRIANTKATALKDRITDLHETVSDAFSGEGESVEESREALPDTDALGEHASDLQGGVTSLMGGDTSGLSTITEAVSGAGEQLSKLAPTLGHVKKLRKNAKEFNKHRKDANEAGEILSHHDDATPGWRHPMRRMQAVQDLMAAKNESSDKGRYGRGLGWRMRMFMGGNIDRSRGNTVERHADEAATHPGISHLMESRTEGHAILGDLAANVQSQYARERNRAAGRTLDSATQVVQQPLNVLTAGVSDPIIRGVQASLRVGDVVGATGEKALREHRNRGAETTYNTTESQADRAMASRRIVRNDHGAATRLLEALSAQVDRKGRDRDIHHHLASGDPAQRAGAMATLKARRSATAPRFDLNDQIESSSSLAGVARSVGRSERVRGDIAESHTEQVAALKRLNKAAPDDTWEHVTGT